MASSEFGRLQEQGSPQALKMALERDGFIVQEGKFKKVDLFAMYDADLVPSCFANNAAAPYLIPLVPLSPGETAPTLTGSEPNSLITDYPLVKEDEGLYMEYFLRPDEAIVLAGKTPPEVTYFGFTSYLVRRYIRIVTNIFSGASATRRITL